MEQQSVGVTILAEKFILPLLGRINDDRSIQNMCLTKLLTLVNSRAIVDFMSDLHIILSPIFQKYSVDSRSLLSFD